MTVLRIGAVVEGHGEVKALPVLLHRIAKEWDPLQTLHITQITRAPTSSLKREGYLESEIENLARKTGRNGGLFVLLDCDDDNGCPKIDGPLWLNRARAARADMEIGLVLAYKEYEAWLIAAAESLRGHCGLSTDLSVPPAPEGIRGAKEWLSRHMPKNRPSAETTDPVALTRVFDMAAARRVSSFDKCYREIVNLFEAVKQRAT